MKKEEKQSDGPALGCKVGQAYQTMLRQLSEALAGAGLEISSGEYLVLRAVYSREGLQQCEIADMVGKDKASVCRTVAALQKKGLVATRAVSHKCLRVYLTDKSRAIEPAIMSVAAKRHQALADATTPEELEIFNRVLDKIINE